MTTYNEMPVKRVAVTATVQFEAYVLDHGDDADPEVYAEQAGRIAHEIADAVQYRAVHLSDSEDNDALIACAFGAAVGAVEVDAAYAVITDANDTDYDVSDAVESTEAWL